MANAIVRILTEFFARYGYWTVFFGVMLENVGLPIPGETVLLFAGFLAYQNKLHIVPSIIVAIAGATAGATLGYGLGRRGGAPLVDRLLGRFPRIRRRYDSSEKVLLKHGHWAVFASRFITGLRVFAGLLAGVLRMPFLTFSLFSFTGAVCWALTIGYVGYFLGSSWDRLVRVVGRLDLAALAFVAVIVVAMLLIRLLRRRKLQ